MKWQPIETVEAVIVILCLSAVMIAAKLSGILQERGDDGWRAAGLVMCIAYTVGIATVFIL